MLNLDQRNANSTQYYLLLPFKPQLTEQNLYQAPASEPKPDQPEQLRIEKVANLKNQRRSTRPVFNYKLRSSKDTCQEALNYCHSHSASGRSNTAPCTPCRHQRGIGFHLHPRLRSHDLALCLNPYSRLRYFCSLPPAAHNCTRTTC